MLVINAYFLASRLVIAAIDNGAMITMDEAEDIIDNNLLFSEIEKFNVSPSKVIKISGAWHPHNSHHSNIGCLALTQFRRYSDNSLEV